MGVVFGTTRKTGVTSSAGMLEIPGNVTLVNIGILGRSVLHQLSLTGAGASGVVPVRLRPMGMPAAYSEPLFDQGVPATIDLANPVSLVFAGLFDAVILDCSGVTGSFDVYMESR